MMSLFQGTPCLYSTAGFNGWSRRELGLSYEDLAMSVPIAEARR